MGNTDGFKEAIASHGNNKVINFNGGYFSFAYGNEIAFIIDDKYWILNCDYHLWEIVKVAIKKTKDKEKLAKW